MLQPLNPTRSPGLQGALLGAPSRKLFASRDLHETRSIVARVMKPHELKPASGGQRMEARMHHASLGDVSLSRLCHGCEVDIDPGALQDFFLVMMPLAGHARLDLSPLSLDIHAQQCAVVSPDQPLTMRWSADCDQLMVRISRSFLERVLAAQQGHALDQPLQFKPGFDWRGSAAWQCVLRFLIDCAESDLGLDQNPLLLGQLQEMVATTLLAEQPHNHREGLMPRTTTATPPVTQPLKRGACMSNTTLADFATSIASGALKVIDLTHTLSPEFPALQLPPQFGQVWGFKQERISQYDDAGPGWYWNNFSCGEHTGTHFDAPVHWISGREHADNSVDTIDPARFIGPACVVDASFEVAANPDWLLDVSFLQAWEARHGRIAAGAWLFFRTGWAKRLADPASFVNMREDGAHTPGPTQAAVEWLIKERDVRGFGVETINTDAGQSYAWPVAYPCHTLMHGANKYGLQCLNNLDQLPPTGAVILAAPLKIKAGSGSPLRVLALVQT